jgi:acetoin utilization protein AcuB
MQVRDRMSTPPITIGLDTVYHKALKLIQEHRLHHLPVVDAQGRIAGIVAERDLLLAASHYVQNPVDVAEIMHREVITSAPEASMESAATLMLNYKIGCLPVVDPDQHVVGMLTETDVFKAFVDLLREHTELKALQSGA